MGHNVSPAENMYAEIYKPSYMFIDPLRKMTVSLANPYHKATLAGEDYFLIKSNTEYTLNVVNSIALDDTSGCATQ
jgi:hypothetical protein